MLLTEVKCKDKVRIKEFVGQNTIIKKIEGMGIRKGDVFEVSRVWGRNLLLKNGVNRLVISFDVAKNIEVEVLESVEDTSCECEPCKKKDIDGAGFDGKKKV